jgi:conjugal transfer pilus assembly protein TraW
MNKLKYSYFYFFYVFFANFIFFIFFTCCVFPCAKAFAKDLGVIGKTYQITEQDFLAYIKVRLVQMQKNGQLEELNQKFIENTKKHADRPVPVAGITRTKEFKRWNFDPTYVVPQDIVTSHGFIARAGSKINPLNLIPLKNELIFYDADDKEQVNWVKKEDKRVQGQDKLILVNGSISSQSKILSNKPIYFDQFGRLTERFGIKHVPAVIRQKGKGLEVIEVKI